MIPSSFPRFLIALVLICSSGLSLSDDSVVIAEIPGGTVTTADLAGLLGSMPVGLRSRLLSNPLQTTAFVEAYIKQRALAAMAVAEGLPAEPSVYYRLEKARNEILGTALREWFLARLQEPDYVPLARERYLAEIDRFRVLPTVRVRHLLLRTSEELSDAEKQSKREQLDVIRKRVIDGEKFATLATEYSEDPGSADRGGDLGFFAKGAMVKPFEEAAFALSEGNPLSDIVETRFGLHLIQFVERKPGKTQSFDEVEKMLVSQVRATYRKAALTEWEDEIANSVAASTNRAAIEAFLSEAVIQAESANQQDKAQQ